MEVIDLLALPSRLRVENFQILAVVHGLVVQAEIVRNGLARVRAVEAVELFEMRIRDLADVLRNFDLRLDCPVRRSTATSLYTPPNTGSLLAVMRRFADARTMSICAPCRSRS